LVVLVLVLLVMRKGLRLAGLGEMGMVALRRGEVVEGLVERRFEVEVC